MIEAELHVIGGKHSGQVIPLNRRKFLIGRESDCQLRPNSELVSRHHCVFSIDDYSVRLRDLGSTNGTTVNGQRIVKEVTLVAGDRCVVGNLEFEFRVLGSSAAAGDETVVSSNETVMELSSTSDSQDVRPDPGVATPLPPNAAAATQQLPAMDQMPPANGDTTVINQPVVMPGQTPYQPMMPQPMGGFPGQAYGGYPYQPQQPMPMYPQGYPQQPMIPGQMPPGYPQPAPIVQPAPIPLSEAGPSDTEASTSEVSLPDPAQTGATDPTPKPVASDTKGEGKAGDGDSTNAAADIIRQYTQRRPGS